jgi:hypothetical protein
MGLFKQMNDLRQVVTQAPAMVTQAQQLAAAAQAQAHAAAAAPAYGTAGYAFGTASIALDDPRLAPIAGVDITLYARLSKLAATERLDEAGIRLRVVAFGISAADWDQASAGWQARMKGDMALAVHFGNIHQQVSV